MERILVMANVQINKINVTTENITSTTTAIATTAPPTTTSKAAMATTTSIHYKEPKDSFIYM